MRNVHQRWASRWFGLLLTIVTLSVAVGCSSYGKVSPKAYECSKALYSICNRQEGARLGKVHALVSEARQAGEITEQEAEWLEDIIEDAKDGDWQKAAQKAREMMKDQVENGP